MLRIVHWTHSSILGNHSRMSAKSERKDSAFGPTHIRLLRKAIEPVICKKCVRERIQYRAAYYVCLWESIQLLDQLTCDYCERDCIMRGYWAMYYMCGSYMICLVSYAWPFPVSFLSSSLNTGIGPLIRIKCSDCRSAWRKVIQYASRSVFTMPSLSSS